MKINKKIKVIFACLFAILLLSLGISKTYADEEAAADTIELGQVVEQVMKEYTCVDGMYCMENNMFSKVTAFGARGVLRLRCMAYSNTFEPSGNIGYAIWMNKRKEMSNLTLQKIIWSAYDVIPAAQNPNENIFYVDHVPGNVGDVDASKPGIIFQGYSKYGARAVSKAENYPINEQGAKRSYEYGLVYSQLIYPLGLNKKGPGDVYENLFQSKVNAENAEVIVSQDEKTYTIGPYTADVYLSNDPSIRAITNKCKQGNSCQGVAIDSVQQILKDELVMNNASEGQNEENTFMKFKEDGVHIYIVDNNGDKADISTVASDITIINAEGVPYASNVEAMKDISKGNQFYIRFKPIDYRRFVNAFTVEIEFQVTLLNKFMGIRGIYGLDYNDGDDKIKFYNAHIQYDHKGGFSFIYKSEEAAKAVRQQNEEGETVLEPAGGIPYNGDKGYVKMSEEELGFKKHTIYEEKYCNNGYTENEYGDCPDDCPDKDTPGHRHKTGEHWHSTCDYTHTSERWCYQPSGEVYGTTKAPGTYDISGTYYILVNVTTTITDEDGGGSSSTTKQVIIQLNIRAVLTSSNGTRYYEEYTDKDGKPLKICKEIIKIVGKNPEYKYVHDLISADGKVEVSYGTEVGWHPYSEWQDKHLVSPDSIMIHHAEGVVDTNYHSFVLEYSYYWNAQLKDKIQRFEKFDIEPFYTDASGLIDLPCMGIFMDIGGKVFIDKSVENKTENKYLDVNGVYDTTDKLYEGIEVTLHMMYYDGGEISEFRDQTPDNDPNTISTITGPGGKYSFTGLDPLKKYYVTFSYNGEIYQPTQFNNIIKRNGPEFSLGVENFEERKELNNLLATINSDVNANGNETEDASSNYSGNKKAYGLNHKIEDGNQNYINIDVPTDNYVFGLMGKSKGDDGILTYGDILEQFRIFAANSTKKSSGLNDGIVEWKGTLEENNLHRIGIINYDKAYSDLSSWLDNTCHLSQKERDFIIQFMKDTTRDATSTKSGTAPTEVGSFSASGGGNIVRNEKNVFPTLDNFICNDVARSVNPQYNTKSGSEYTAYGTWSERLSNLDYLYTDADYQKDKVNLGLFVRPDTDIEINQDVYKVTTTVDGKELKNKYNMEYVYHAGEATGTYNFDIQNKMANEFDNGTVVYNRAIRYADYMFDGKEDSYTEGYSKDVDEAEEEAISNEATRAGILNKNLEVYITYKIQIFNAGYTNVEVNELVDYYDNVQLEYFDTADKVSSIQTKNQLYTKSETIAPDDNKDSLVNNTTAWDINVNKEGTYGKHNNNLKYGNDYDYSQAVYIKTNGNTKLKPGESGFYYITFKVKKVKAHLEKMTTSTNGDDIIKNEYQYKIIMDTDDENNIINAGKRNIVEINSYKTTYAAGTKVPISNNNSYSVANMNAGIVDIDSNPGSLRNVDIYNSNNAPKNDEDGSTEITYIGRLIITKNGTPEQKIHNTRAEDDNDQAPNVVLNFADETDIRRARTIKGNVFEDIRNTPVEDAIIGDGKYIKPANASDSNADIDISGVTVQLVRLDMDVNSDGIASELKGEVICDYETWEFANKPVYGDGRITDLNGDHNDLIKIDKNSDRYETTYGQNGQGKEVVIKQGREGSKVYITPANLSTGEYSFTGIPAGYYYVRFIYGDTDHTVLTDIRDHSEVLDGDRSGDVNNVLEKNGYNSKSYNGQDYKSTTYNGHTTDLNVKNVEKTANVLTFRGYGNVENQNYEGNKNSRINDDNGILLAYDQVYKVNDGTNINSMYAFDMSSCTSTDRYSDAKDVSAYRARANDYARGYDFEQNAEVSNNETLRNYRAEVLASPYKLGTYDRENSVVKTEDGVEKTYESNLKSRQEDMIEELKVHTQMVAQTGIIDLAGELDAVNGVTIDSYQVGDNEYATTSVHDFTVKNVDFGIVERPKAQLMLNKEIKNIKFVLSSGIVIFDTNKTQNDLLAFQAHKKHDVITNRVVNNEMLKQYKLNGLTVYAIPPYEDISAALDDEILENSLLEVTYELTVKNVGDADYTDKEFYYLGKESDKVNNIVKTAAHRVIDYPGNDFTYTDADQQKDSLNKSYWQLVGPYFAVDQDISEVSDSSHNKDAEQSSGYKENPNNEPTMITIEIPNELRAEGTPDNEKKAQAITERNASEYEAFKAEEEAREAEIKALNYFTEHHKHPSWSADYVNREYLLDLQTYNSILVTKELGEELTPGQEDKVNLVLKTTTSVMAGDSDFTYNNLAEIIETKNTNGRRMAFSISGNQQMANQDANSNAASSVITSIDRIQVAEIDADSAQRIQLRAPTGDDKQIVVIVAAIIASLALIGIGIIVVRKSILKKK